MFQRSNAWQLVKLAALAGTSALLMSSCVSTDTNSNLTQVTPQGTVELQKIRAGMPESIFRSAKITFAVDTHPEASKGGKTQYLSRTYVNHGQYVAQCLGETCYELQVMFKPPIDKADGLAMVPQLMSSDAGTETVVDDSVMKNQKRVNTEFHYFGGKGVAFVDYSDKSATKIDSIEAFALPPEQAFKKLFGKVPAVVQIPASSKVTVAESETPTSN